MSLQPSDGQENWQKTSKISNKISSVGPLKNQKPKVGILIPEKRFHNFFLNASIQTDPLIYGLCMLAAFYHMEELSAGYYLGM